MVKSWQLADERYRREEAEYLATNPHEQELRSIFAAAEIDYGRIDYALLGEQIQVWEINTNPMIVASGRGGNGIAPPCTTALPAKCTRYYTN